VVSDVPVDDEASMVTLRISRSVGAQSFGGAHRGRVCVRIHKGECACVVSVRVVPCESKKSHNICFFLLNLRRNSPFSP
jgi:hypothetical protein